MAQALPQCTHNEDDLILPTFVEKLVNRLIEVHTEVEKLSKNQETRLDKDEKSDMMQRLVFCG